MKMALIFNIDKMFLKNCFGVIYSHTKNIDSLTHTGQRVGFLRAVWVFILWELYKM